MSEIIIEPAKTNNNLGAIVKLLDNENLTQSFPLHLHLALLPSHDYGE